MLSPSLPQPQLLFHRRTALNNVGQGEEEEWKKVDKSWRSK